MKNLSIIWRITVTLLLGLTIYIEAQNPSWVMTQLPGNFPSSYHYAVGETGMIFVDDTSQVIHAFDIYDGQWNAYISLTNATWTGADAEGNVAMVWSDSTLVAYSTLTHSFSSLQNAGHLINGGATHGCTENFAYVVTPTDWYVFDAEDAQWHVYNYTSPGNPGATILENVQGKKDYIFLHVSVLNEIPSTLMAYSRRTKTFAERNLDYLSNPYLLDHGFTFYYYHFTGPFYCGGYSAYTGNFSMKNSTELISPHPPGYYPEIVTEKITYGFTMHEPISAEFYRRWLWIYNTVTGSFGEYWWVVDYAGTNAVPHGLFCGGQFAVDWVQNVGYGDQMECIVYSSANNSFNNFFSPLYYYGSIYTSFSSGGNIFDGYDSVKYYIHDVETGADHSAAVVWETGFQPGVKARSLNDYWSVFAYRDQFEDTLHIFSYSRETGNFTKLKIRNDGSSGKKHGRDIFWIRVQDSFEPDKILLYSPKGDNWYQKDLTAATFWGGEGSYFYLNDGGLNQLQLFDGYLDQEFIFPSAQSSGYVIARDSVFLMYTTTGKYIGYSPITHDTSQYITANLGGQNWNKYIVLALDGNYYDHLLYDGYHNTFTPLQLTAQHGIRRNAWPGGRTALVTSANGYLFAYYPGQITSIGPNSGQITGVPQSFELYQNYPNPFNPMTHIKFDLPQDSKVKITIFNVLGQKVTTLVDNKLSAGRYNYQWKPSGIASGLYFYSIEAEHYRKVRKMIFVK